MFGSSVAIDGAYAVAGAPGDDGAIGAVYVFKRTGATWDQVCKITASAPAAGDSFGWSVSILDKQIVLGRPAMTTTAAPHICLKPSREAGSRQSG